MRVVLAAAWIVGHTVKGEAGAASTPAAGAGASAAASGAALFAAPGVAVGRPQLSPAPGRPLAPPASRAGEAL
eukprot:6129586-Lingulodinium_polyedra.AAC.1